MDDEKNVVDQSRRQPQVKLLILYSQLEEKCKENVAKKIDWILSHRGFIEVFGEDPFPLARLSAPFAGIGRAPP
jgi:hypothetical protein